MELKKREQKRQREAREKNIPVGPPKLPPPKKVEVPTMGRNGKMPIAFSQPVIVPSFISQSG